MPRLQMIEADQAEGVAATTLKTAPINIFKGLANSPVVMEGLMALSNSFGKGGALTPAEAEVVMLRVSERNGCGYCLAAHTKIADGHGIDGETALKFRRGEGGSDRDQALLAFVDAIAANGGWIDDEQFEAFKAAGFGDDAVVEVVALLAWMTFTNTFNHVNQTELDFPAVPEPAGA